MITITIKITELKAMAKIIGTFGEPECKVVQTKAASLDFDIDVVPSASPAPTRAEMRAAYVLAESLKHAAALLAGPNGAQENQPAESGG